MKLENMSSFVQIVTEGSTVLFMFVS